MTRKEFLPFARPDLDETELAEIQEALESGWITTGPKTKQFEAAFAEYVGAEHAIAVNSCTAAMHLALEAIGIEQGDRVLTSPFTFASTAEVIRYFHAEPVFADIDPQTLNLDPAKAAQRIEALREKKPGNLKAIIPVHIGGNPCEMDAINQVARENGLIVIEDAAHALPTKYKGRMIGSQLDTPHSQLPTHDSQLPTHNSPLTTHHSLTCFSFYATKSLTTGEGGMITTDNDDWAERCRVMSLHGISKDAWKRYTAEGSWYYEIIAPGFKYNLTDIAAAMGLAQLRKIDRMWSRRREIAQVYTTAFDLYPQLQSPAEPSSDGQHAWHLYSLRLNLERLSIDRARFIQELKQRNIGVSVHFIPLHLHPYYRQTYCYQPEDFPVAYREYQRVISLPIYSKMTDRDVADVIAAVEDVIETYSV
jgi:perosamine synthetase